MKISVEASSIMWAAVIGGAVSQIIRMLLKDFKNPWNWVGFLVTFLILWGIVIIMLKVIN